MVGENPWNEVRRLPDVNDSFSSNFNPKYTA